VEKVEKNYFRNELIELIELLNGKPVTVTAKYKYTNSPEWATFTTVRLYSPGEKKKTIYNHINIKKADV